jgi:hypothetical protein
MVVARRTRIAAARVTQLHVQPQRVLSWLSCMRPLILDGVGLGLVLPVFEHVETIAKPSFDVLCGTRRLIA